jgi:hypothetical protein
MHVPKFLKINKSYFLLFGNGKKEILNQTGYILK